MAKPKKATTDAHVSGFSLTAFDAEHWADFEAALERPLSRKKRSRIQEVTNRYIGDKLLAVAGADRVKALPLLQRLDRAMLRLVQAWQAVEESTAARSMVVGRMGELSNAFDLGPLVSHVGSLRFALGLNVVASAAKQNATAIDPAFVRFVGGLAEVIGGATARNDFDSSRRLSPFVEFMSRINDALPTEAQHPNTGALAWSRIVARALRQSRTK